MTTHMNPLSLLYFQMKLIILIRASFDEHRTHLAAIAGVIDLLRTQGSFALSVRYALCLTLPSSKVEADPAVPYPTVEEYEEIAKTFEKVLNEQLNTDENNTKNALEDISSDEEKRAQLALEIMKTLRSTLDVLPAAKQTTILGESSRGGRRGAAYAMGRLAKFVSSDEEDADLGNFVQAVVDAFFDNDLLHSTRLFLHDAKGSFGLMVASSLDAHRQTCFAARGQTLSIGFYPRKGLICYGSEQAAVKAGLNYENPGGNIVQGDTREADNAVRLDLDDLVSRELSLLFLVHLYVHKLTLIASLTGWRNLSVRLGLWVRC